jgi:hypothetical protein
MMRIKTYTCLVSCMILVAGCQQKNSGVVSVITVPLESANEIDIGQFIESVHYVQLENHPESAFTDIDKMLVCDKNMFMLDKRLEAVFCFDTSGKFRYRIQRVGRGPGEYQELDAMWVKPAEQELWLQSFWPSKIMVYNFDGRMLREFGIRWSARDMTKVGNNLLAGYNTSRSNDGIDSLDEGIFLLGEDGKSRGQAKILGDSSIYWSVVFQRSMEEFENGALVLSQSDTIFRINTLGEVSPDVFLDWGKLKYPKDLAGILYDSPRSADALGGKYVSGKDQLVAFGPIRLFRVFLENHMELAIADLNTKKGIFSARITSNIGKVPLLNPFAKSDKGELVGIYDISLLMAMKESQANRKEDSMKPGFYHEMDSLVESALICDRPVLWFAKIKQEWLTKSY